MTSLKGRVALITGVSRRNGIGFALARRLASQGADLFVHAFAPYDEELALIDDAPGETERLLAELRHYKTQIAHLDADFLDPQAPARLVQAAVERFAHLDVLIVNHTRDTLTALPELTAEEIDRHLAVNVRAALLLIRAFARQHDGRAGGRIVLLTSGQHLGPMPHLAYVASKGALHQLTASLSDLFIDRGITVNTVNPGPTKTYTPEDAIDRDVLQRMPLGRWGTPADAARLIAWLVSDEAAWITGQVINSEGGFRRWT